MKLGRNQTCWCGSGKKYKKCHLGRENEELVRHWQASKEHKDAFSVKECLSPSSLHEQCDGKIVSAHTIPKSGSLKKIARNGHVYAFVPSLDNLRKQNGVIKPQLLGINKASTFTGFCGYHDNNIFSPLEDEEFVGSNEQIFLLGYRAGARELYTKKAAASLSEFRSKMDKGRSIDDQYRIQTMSFISYIGVSAGLRDSEHYKAIYDDILIKKNFDTIKYLRISIEGPPSVMVSGGIFPEINFNGNELQDFGNIETILDLINFSSFYGENQGEIIFSWLPESESACKPFIESLLEIESDKMGNALIRFFFEFCENIFLMPDWWESLDEATKLSLVSRISSSANPSCGRNNNCLKEDGLHYVDWKVLNVSSNI